MVLSFVHLSVWFASAWWLVSAGEFLSSRQRFGSQNLSVDLVQEVVIAEVANKDGHIALQQELLSMYRALPKNEHERLDPDTARFALHRFFVYKYGWYVKGLDPKGESWATSSDGTISKGRLPQHVQSLIVREDGLDLADLATFASILSTLIEDEVDVGLDEIFRALKMPEAHISDELFERAVEGYLARFIYGGEDAVRNEFEFKGMMHEVVTMYRDWPDTAIWSRDVVRTHDWLQRDRQNPFIPFVRTQESAIANVRGMMHRFNHLSSPECLSVKSELMEHEVAGTGRISLVDFYSGMHRKRESIPYLRNLGVLDESDPHRPMLLITNFITSSVNCLMDSSYYSSCCPNQCEGLMSHLERVLAAPEASPGRIVELVSQMPSDTVDAPRNISASLLGKLQAIADQNDNKVPLNGRLFAQWMHHAYPRECPYPQQSGTSKPLSQDEFMEKHDVDDVFLTPAEMAAEANRFRRSARATKDMPWDSVEELVAKHREAGSWKFGGLRPFVVVAAFVSMAWPLARSPSILSRGSVVEYKTHAHLV